MTAVFAVACVHPHPTPGTHRPFDFARDSFAFANVTVWEYLIDPATKRVEWRKRDPVPPFSLRCGTMARSARQFWEHARFRPDLPVADGATYERLAQAVLATDPRRRGGTRIEIPGYADLRAFSRAHEALLKRALAGPWLSYMQRGNWRMIFPFSPRHQLREARQLLRRIRSGRPAVVHVLRHPKRTINHLVLAYAAEETPTEIRFDTYDPNDASSPVTLTWNRAARTFAFPPTPYFPGGPIRAYEVYHAWLY